MSMCGPQYKYQAIIWPKGGGEVLDSRLIPLRPHVEPSTMLAHFESRYGPSLDVAHTVADGKRINIGWVFDAPADVDVGADPGGLELVVIPMLTDPETQEDVSMFIYQARLKADFLATCAAHDVNVTVISLPQAETEADRTDDPQAPGAAG